MNKLPKRYRLRAELILDLWSLLNLLGDEVAFVSWVRVGMLPDVVAEVHCRTLNLCGLVEVCRKVPDGHVMVETVNDADRFTGERYDDVISKVVQ